jgi:hypothetical protein
MDEYLLQVRLGDPDIVLDPSEYQKLAQCIADPGRYVWHNLSFIFFT